MSKPTYEELGQSVEDLKKLLANELLIRVYLEAQVGVLREALEHLADKSKKINWWIKYIEGEAPTDDISYNIEDNKDVVEFRAALAQASAALGKGDKE